MPQGLRTLVPALALLLLFEALLAVSAQAEVKVAAVFGECMVLQRDRPIPIWGRAEAGEALTIDLGDTTLRTRADAEGRWHATLPARGAGGPHVLRVSGSSTVTFNDVLIGEVWICSGQSNMQWPVSRSADPESTVAGAVHPRMRLLTVAHRPAASEQSDFKGRWVACTPTSVKNFSAVAYHFGRALLEELEVPIGLINTSYGGTPAEAWTSIEALRAEPKLAPLVKGWERQVRDKKKVGARAPAVLFNGMIAPLVPYAVRGAIWYQGESNARRAEQYRTLFPTLIRDWRARWKQETFPFYFVQLANFMARAAQPGPSRWAELREAQRLTLGAVANTGMAVIIDIGEAKNIHPVNKKDVGRRLAAWALAKDYGKSVPFSGPLFLSMKRTGDRAVLTFEHIAGGLASRSAEPLTGFAVAGQDHVFHWAQAEIVGETVVIRCPEVKRIESVRYAWANNPACNLVNGAGFPASPFRTDDWPARGGSKR